MKEKHVHPSKYNKYHRPKISINIKALALSIFYIGTAIALVIILIGGSLKLVGWL